MTTQPDHPPPDDAGDDPAHDQHPARRLLLPEDLVTDQALTDGEGDQFDHAAIAKAVADLTLSSATPVNIALFGPWGSGKSSFYDLMKRRVLQQQSDAVVVRYDAWKYGGQDLKRNFIQEIAAQLDIDGKSDLDRELTLNQEQSRIRLKRWFYYNWGSIIIALLVGLGVAALWAGVHAAVDARWVQKPKTFLEVLPSHVNEFGLVLAAVLTALLLGPKAVESAVVKTTRPAAERDDQFARAFKSLVQKIQKQRPHGYERLMGRRPTRRNKRIVFFIDELDRCEPDDVVATLIDLKTFLDEPGCVFVVAADRAVLEHALRKVPQAKPVRDDNPYYSTPGAFIDKIFQHQIALPPLRSHSLSSFANRLVSDRPNGLWRELQQADPTGRLFNDVVYILVPSHVSSPRRVKVLLNNFATNARIAQSRHINWLARAQELALLTVLETEFPTVAADLIHFPDLLAYVRREKDRDDPELSAVRKQQIERLDPDGDAGTTSDSVAGEIVRETGHDKRQAHAANRELARQLNDYLNKLGVVENLQDPRPDLFYLRVVGYDEGLTDPALGEMIDLAPERQPKTVVEAFADQPESIKALAARLLINTLATERGTGQANVIESACRIIAQLPREAIRKLEHLAPDILTHIQGPSWRPNATPGAVRLAVANGQSADAVKTLLDTIDFTTEPNQRRLQAIIPTLEWADDATAAPIHAKVADSITYIHEPLTTLLADLPNDTAERAWDAIAHTVETYYTTNPTTAVPLLDALIAATTSRTDPNDLLWKVLFQATKTKNPAILARLHETRDTYVPHLDEESRALIALYQIEVGPQANWTDWTPLVTSHIEDPAPDLSKWSRDAAQAIAKTIPTTHEDLTNTINAVCQHTTGTNRDEAFTTLTEQIAFITWNDPSDPDGHRWTNLHTMSNALNPTDPELKKAFGQSFANSLHSNIATQIPAMTGTATPTDLITEWRTQIATLPIDWARGLEAALAKITAPTGPANVELLRLRIASRIQGKSPALPTQTLLPYANELGAPVMAGEWLTLRPKVHNVIAVAKSINIGSGPLARYADTLTPDDRTSLWIALETDDVSPHHLRVVGREGITGAAITHMADEIVTATQQSKRDAAMRRLTTAKFTEKPTPNEGARGKTVGHAEASKLALRLIDTGYNDNIVLAARIVIHSDGYAYGTKTKLRTAFTNFANGKQSHTFTKAQATQLHALELLDLPKKTSRFAWLRKPTK